MIYFGENPVGIALNSPLPKFVNNFDSGSFVNTGTSSLEIPLNTITTLPEGILVYNSDFDVSSPKVDKPFLGAYCALFIKGGSDIALSSPENVYYLVGRSGYYVNWGGDTGSKAPSKRDSRTETRGLYYYRPSNNSFGIRGFGTGEYDFKYNIPYYWIAWD